MAEHNTPRTYTLQEVADILQLTWRTVWQYVHDGKIRAIKCGRTWRVTEAALQKFLNSGTGSGVN